MKIAFFEMEKWETNYVKDKLKKHTLKCFDETIDEENLSKIKDFDAICVFVYSDVTKEVLDKLPNLKLVVTMSTGFDHIDLEECKKRKIKAYNVPDYAENTVAEHTFALILSLSRRICESWDDFRKGEFDLNELRGFDLKGKTLGIIGVGRIGKRVIKMAKSFEMNVIAYDIVKNNNVKYVSLDSLLKNSDVISLHCPLTKDNEYMINAKTIKKMKDSVVFINTARGKLVDTCALIKAVKNGKIKGVGLDVLENEEEIKEEPEVLFKKTMHKSKAAKLECDLLKLNNVILTPHNAFNSDESLRRLLDKTIENLKGGKHARIA
jgi:D-lactate dehydrogenase